MKCFNAPAPELRLPAWLYADVRQWMLDNDQDAARMLQWSRDEIGPPTTPEDMAGEITWIILCAGRSAQAARTIETRVTAAINAGTPVVEAFGYRAKAEAIETAWRDRAQLFVSLQAVLARGEAQTIVDWCGALPYVGDDTKFQLAKNFGVDVCKPDIWLCRLTGIADKPRLNVKLRFPACMALCTYLSAESGDRIAVVDSLLWLACNKGVLVVDDNGGAIEFNKIPAAKRSIYSSAHDAEPSLFGDAP